MNIDDAIRFLSKKSDEKIKTSSSNEDDKDQLEEEQEEEAGEITSVITNRVF
jgi:hypothetical protein